MREKLSLDINANEMAVAFDCEVVTTPPASMLNDIPLTPGSAFKIPYGIAGQLEKVNQLLMWVDDMDYKILNQENEIQTKSKTWTLSWKTGDRNPVIFGSLDNSGACLLKDQSKEPLLIVERWDKTFSSKNNSRIGAVKLFHPPFSKIVTVEQLNEGSTKILQLHIENPNKTGIRIIRIEPSSASCICCLLCTTPNKFEMTISDGGSDIGVISGSLSRQNSFKKSPETESDNTGHYPVPYLLMSVGFNANVDSETKLLVISGLMVAAIQQVFVFFGDNNENDNVSIDDSVVD